MRGRPGEVLYVTYDGLLEPLGASQVLPYVRGLARAGVSMSLLSFEKPEDLIDDRRARVLREELDAAGIDWTALTYHKRPSLPATAWDVAQGRRHVARWARELRRRGVPGLIHARGYLPGLMGLAGRRAKGGPRLLFDMRGFWVDERIEAGYWQEGGLPARLGRVVERRLLREADHLILLTQRAAGRLPERSGGAAIPPCTVVPTCVDLDRFSRSPDRERDRRALGIPEGPVLIHTGTLTGWYDGRATMEVARGFLEAAGGTFVILTRDIEAARRLLADAGVSAMVTSVPPADVPRWLNAADAGLALVRPTPAKDASFPTKVGEYLAAGLAVLGTPVGDMELFEDRRVLRLMRSGDSPDEMARWLADAVRPPGRSADARALAEARLGLAHGVEALLGVYAALGVGRGGA